MNVVHMRKRPASGNCEEEHCPSITDASLFVEHQNKTKTKNSWNSAGGGKRVGEREETPLSVDLIAYS